MKGMSISRYFASRLAVGGTKKWRRGGGGERTRRGAWEQVCLARMPRTPRFFWRRRCAVCRWGSAATLAHHYKSMAVSSEPSIPRAPPALCAVIIAKRGPVSQICRWERGTWHSHHQTLAFFRLRSQNMFWVGPLPRDSPSIVFGVPGTSRVFAASATRSHGMSVLVFTE